MTFALTRRRALSILAGTAVPASAVAGAAPFMRAGTPTENLTPEERLASAVEAMEAAMIAVHGEGVRVIRNGNHIISFLEPEKPRIVEWQGDGDYEIEWGDKRPIFRVVRFSAYDDFKDGRCYRLTPQAMSLDIRYMYKRDLQRVLIRKIR